MVLLPSCEEGAAVRVVVVKGVTSMVTTKTTIITVGWLLGVVRTIVNEGKSGHPEILLASNLVQSGRTKAAQ